jgi:mannose-1-phosphate guanylyltransferase/mannose-6-phosphate isomerase
MIIPVILAGGSGTRLWPLSRQQYPKQFLKLFGDQTMLQQTLLRLKGLADLADPIIVCNEDHRFTVAEQLQEVNIKGSIILEPAARNTAPAIALAAELALVDANDDPILLVLPADHLIKNIEGFHLAIIEAVASAQSGNLVTFGIVPTRPETGYGYIEIDSGQRSAVCSEPTPSACDVLRFVEKPDLPTAQQYLNAGNYLWNSGMFVFKAKHYLKALKQHSPASQSAANAAFNKKTVDADFIRVDKTSFESAPNISIDYAVMEKSDSVTCVPLNAAWSDVGCWKSYWETADKDNQGNINIGDVISVKTKNTMVYSNDKLVSTLGVEDLVIVSTPDATLIVHKDHAQGVKEVTKVLSDAERSEHINHRKVNRPWGYYDSVVFGERFQVKRIQVKPGASLSLQMHHHRAEHWIVVKGTATVQRGEEKITLTENESTYIPLGIKHRLSNPGKMPLEIIEVQSGSYLGEDDIVRYDDTYGRK